MVSAERVQLSHSTRVKKQMSWKELDRAAEDASATSYDAIYVDRTYLSRLRYKQFTKLVRRYAGPNDVILDLGCGTGATAARLSELRICGIDFSSMLTTAMERIEGKLGH